jgi:hypothetical protein
MNSFLKNEMIGKSVYSFVHPSDHSKFKNLFLNGKNEISLESKLESCDDEKIKMSEDNNELCSDEDWKEKYMPKAVPFNCQMLIKPIMNSSDSKKIFLI